MSEFKPPAAKPTSHASHSSEADHVAPLAVEDFPELTPQGQSAELPLENTSTQHPAPVGWVRRLLRVLGVDRAIGFTVLARGWSSISGLGTLALIAHFLTPAEQGFYYTFYSLVAVQIVFELGFSVVILQTASHEAAHLDIAANGDISGPEREHARLASILQKSVSWYTVAAVLMVLVLLPLGVHFFRDNTADVLNQHIHWGPAWGLVVLTSACMFQIDPLFSFLEGCGYVPEVARTRLHQAIFGTLLGWVALLLHHGLFAPGLMIGGRAIAGSWLLIDKKNLLWPLLRKKAGDLHIKWGAEIWPFQWRIAISWLCGYFTFQIFNPILFKYRGPVEAGQMGMTLNVCGTLSSMAVAWMNTKAAPFGRMIALKEYRKLDSVFFRSLWQSTGAAIGIAVVVWGVTDYCVRHGYAIAHRLLAPVPLALMLFVTVANIIVFAEALYLRAHKQEKFMINSILGALYIAPIALWMGIEKGPHYGAWGISAAAAIGTVFIGLGYGTYTFLHWRRIWHEG